MRNLFKSILFMIILCLLFFAIIISCENMKLKSPDENYYTVTFDKTDAGATGTMSDQTIASGSSANLTACGFSKTGWTFAGWATIPTGNVIYADGASYTMGSANVTLYAKWTDHTYKVTYNGNGNTGGAVPAGPTNYYEGEEVTVLGNTGNFVKTGDSFARNDRLLILVYRTQVNSELQLWFLSRPNYRTILNQWQKG